MNDEAADWGGLLCGVGFFRVLRLRAALGGLVYTFPDSYSGVPGRGGTPFGRPPAHSGIMSTILPTLASRVPLAQEASAVPTINNAIRRIMARHVSFQEGRYAANQGQIRTLAKSNLEQRARN